MTREELLPQEILEQIPPLYTNEETTTDKIIIKVKYFIVSFTWLVAECEVQDDDVLFYGYVINHSDPTFSEWGYFTLSQLMEVRLMEYITVELDLWFKECRFGEYMAKERDGS